ncbi:MAG: hypothetical protein MI923_16185 [Phycisphaerales bacterium]|nr:hypothetical protein [Phycisphaerales bacterium]
MSLRKPRGLSASAARGPFSVDGAASGQLIRVDPDSSRIEYAGPARPIHKEHLIIPFYTQGGLASTATLHNDTTMQYGFIDGATRHLHALLLVREYIDVAEDIEFKALTYGNADISGLTVRNDVVVEKIGDGGSYATLRGPSSFDFAHASATTLRKAVLRTMYTLPGGSVDVGDMLQIDFIREGGHVNDDLDTTWHIVGIPWIEFRRKLV